MKSPIFLALQAVCLLGLAPPVAAQQLSFVYKHRVPALEVQAPEPAVKGLLSPAQGSSASFGEVFVGAVAARTFQFTNSGSEPLTGVYAEVASQDFSFAQGSNSCGTSSAPVVLAPGQTCTFIVEVRPSAAADFTAQLQVFNGSQVVSALTVTGSAAAAPASSWQPLATGTTAVIRAMAYNGTAYVAVTTDSTGIGRLVSSSGVSWTHAGLYSFSGSSAVSNVALSGPNAHYFAVQKSVVPEGVTLSNAGGVLSGGTTGMDLRAAETSSSGLTVMVGANGAIRTASGLSLGMSTPRASPVSTTLNGLALGEVSGAPLWVAVGDAGKIVTSTDGVNWLARASGVSAPFYDIAYGNGVFLAVGYRVMLISADGATWSPVTMPALTVSFNAVTFGKGTFVVGGSGGFLATSNAPSLSWAVRESAFEGASIADLRFYGGKFYAMGAQGRLSVSE